MYSVKLFTCLYWICTGCCKCMLINKNHPRYNLHMSGTRNETYRNFSHNAVSDIDETYEVFQNKQRFKRTLFNNTRLYKTQIFDKSICFK